MGTGDILLGGNLSMDLPPVQGAEAILLGALWYGPRYKLRPCAPPPPPPGRQSGCKGLKSGTRIQSARLAHIPHYPIAFSGDLSSLFSRLHLNSQEKILSWDSEYPEVSASLDNACTVDYRLTQRRRGFHSHRTTRVDGFILSAQ